MAKQDICVELVNFVKVVAALKTNDEEIEDKIDVLDDLIMNARSLMAKMSKPSKDNRVIVHYERWKDGRVESGKAVWGSLDAMRQDFPESRYNLVERPIRTRRGSAAL